MVTFIVLGGLILIPTWLLWAEEREARAANPQGPAFGVRLKDALKTARWSLLTIAVFIVYSISTGSDPGKLLMQVGMFLVAIFWLISHATSLLKQR